MTPETNTVHLSVADAYDRWSRLYDGYDNPMVFAAGQAIRGLAEDIVGKAVLEFGCGTGRNLAALKAAGAARLVGLDLSGGMLEAARARDASLELFQQDMAAPVPSPDHAFDLVLFCLTLEHVADVTTPLREAARVVKPGGRVVVIEIHPFLALNGVGAHFEDDGQQVRMPIVSHAFADYINAASAAGLAIDACREWRASDLGRDVPAKLLKRGPEGLWTVQWVMRPSSGAPASS